MADQDWRRPWSPTSRPQPPPTQHRRHSFTLPTTRPPRSNIPLEQYGCCYNSGDARHISAKCWKKTKCVRCGGEGHITRDCQSPRRTSSVDRSRSDTCPSPRHLLAAPRRPSPPASGQARVISPTSPRRHVASPCQESQPCTASTLPPRQGYLTLAQCTSRYLGARLRKRPWLRVWRGRISQCPSSARAHRRWCWRPSR